MTKENETQNRGESAEFELWLKTKFVAQIWKGGHRFKKTPTNDVEVDGVLFTEEEVKELFQMLNSRNPFTRLNGTIIIWERNGTLVKFFLIIALVMLLIVYVVVRR
jgi:hypothetical protein